MSTYDWWILGADSHINSCDFIIHRIIIHCQAGISRSQTVALFIAKYYYKDSKLYHILLNQKGKIRGGNPYVYNILQKEMNKCNITNLIKL